MPSAGRIRPIEFVPLVCNAEKLIHFTAVKMSHRELVVSALSSEIEIV